MSAVTARWARSLRAARRVASHPLPRTGGSMRVNRRPIAAVVPVAAVSLALVTGCGGSSAVVASDRAARAVGASGARKTSSTAAPSSPTTGRAAITLRGEPGVSTAQLRRASALLAATIAALPRYATPAQAYALGYRSIGDTASRDEHYVNWAYVNDGHILDPAR